MLKSGEGNSAPLERMDQERAKLHEVLREYDQRDIFNCDETDLHLSFHIFIFSYFHSPSSDMFTTCIII